jgi:hypothetical protein
MRARHCIAFVAVAALTFSCAHNRISTNNPPSLRVVLVYPELSADREPIQVIAAKCGFKIRSSTVMNNPAGWWTGVILSVPSSVAKQESGRIDALMRALNADGYHPDLWQVESGGDMIEILVGGASHDVAAWAMY